MIILRRNYSIGGVEKPDLTDETETAGQEFVARAQQEQSNLK